MELHHLRHSRALESAGYDPAAGTLQLRFRNGALYDYFEVPMEVYEGLTTSAHPWTEWQQHIKSSYDYERLE